MDVPASIDPQYAQAIGKQIAAARRAGGLTQDDLCRRVGNSKNAVSNWERGASAPTIQNLRELCQALAVTPQQLLLMDGHPPVVESDRAARDLVNVLTGLRERAEEAVPDLLAALKDAEDRARRIADPSQPGR